jgi:putative oxidoreductase
MKSDRRVKRAGDDMKIAALIARILLGLMFLVFGLNGFLNFIPAPATLPGPAGAFNTAMQQTHYTWFVSGVQTIAGVLLLTNQFVPLAIVTLAAVLANILVFHLTMLPMGFPVAIVATVLWFIVALPLRAHFAPLFARHADGDAIAPVPKR